MVQFAYSLLFWTFITLSSLMLFPVAVLLWALTSPFDRRKVILHRFTCFWASLYSWFNPAWPVTVVGRDRVPRDQACVMVANHLSLVDILILFRLHTHYKWVSKQENFKVPFIGWNMSLNDYIQLKRGDRASVLRMMRSCEKALADGSSIMMFPEGTRSPTGRMRSFKTGAFELALKTHSPILPIVIQGTADVLPKSGFILRGRHPIRIEVLEPLPYESFADKSVEELTRDVREVIAKHVVTDGGDAVAGRGRRAARAEAEA
jgi:1-acyl-sn-glycerol-3-phosphate acyltransferase